LGAEIVASYLYQVHLYHWLETNDYGRFLASNDLWAQGKGAVPTTLAGARVDMESTPSVCGAALVCRCAAIEAAAQPRWTRSCQESSLTTSGPRRLVSPRSENAVRELQCPTTYLAECRPSPNTGHRVNGTRLQAW